MRQQAQNPEDQQRRLAENSLHLPLKGLRDIVDEACRAPPKFPHAGGQQEYPGVASGLMDDPGCEAVVELRASRSQQLLGVSIGEWPQAKHSNPRVSPEVWRRRMLGRGHRDQKSQPLAADRLADKVLRRFSIWVLDDHEGLAVGRLER